MNPTITIRISGELLRDMLTQDSDVTRPVQALKCIEGLPKDAKLISAFYEVAEDHLVIMFSHESFQGMKHIDVRYESTYASST